MNIFLLLILCVALLQGCGTEERSLITWDEKKVVISEVEKDYEVWFLTDLHMTMVSDEDLPEVKQYALERQGVFAGQKPEDSAEVLAEFISKANRNKPDLVIFGGDILDFPSEGNLTELKNRLNELEVPYLFVMGNHDWTYPWEYMTENATQTYRSQVEEATDVAGYADMIQWEDITFLSIDNSSNQVAPQAEEMIKQAYETNNPIVLIQHVPFSTENLIKRAKKDWSNPVTLGMQVHGGIPVNTVSGELYQNVWKEDSQIRLVLSGHVHFAYEELFSQNTTEIVGDAALKAKATKIVISSK